MNKKLEREGYNQKEGDLSIPERIMKKLKNYGILLIPIFNVALSLVSFLKFDDLYEVLKEKLLKEEKIIPIKKLNENMPKSNGEKLMPDKNNAAINLSLHSVDVNNFKKFEEMTKNEKVDYLESLKKSILEMPEDEKNEKRIPSKACVIFKNEEEEKRFSEIASIINHAKYDSQEKINVYRKKI